MDERTAIRDWTPLAIENRDAALDAIGAVWQGGEPTTAAPRLVKQPFKAGSIDYPPGVSLAANAYLVHHDPKNYADPYAFRPERFLDEPPGTYTWIPFGGGRRRCLGASFAQLEMQTVLRAVLGRWEIRPAHRRPETAARRWIGSCRREVPGFGDAAEPR